MRILSLQLLLSAAALAFIIATSAALGVEPTSEVDSSADWPREVVVVAGDVRTRIDGPKRWTLSGIDFQQTVMATEDSAYGTVATIRNVGHLGTAHFLDLPGKPGQVEKEQVSALQMFVDDQPVTRWEPTMNLFGKSFRMERKSTIRALALETTIVIRDDMLFETARLRGTGSIDLQCVYPWMYAFTHQATDFVVGGADGALRRGKFMTDGKVASQVIEHGKWIAVFEPTSGKGSVCCFLQHTPSEHGAFLVVDAPGVYHKVAAYCLVDEIVQEGFEGTYQSGVGFFRATEKDWEEQASRRAAEIQAANPSP